MSSHFDGVVQKVLLKYVDGTIEKGKLLANIEKDMIEGIIAETTYFELPQFGIKQKYVALEYLVGGTQQR